MIERISILLHFPGDANPIDVSSLYRDGTSHFAERLFNEDKHSVQDTFSCALKHDQGIVDKFRSARGKIRIVVLDASDGNGLFSGVIEPSAAQASHQVNEDLLLEAVDATWRLNDPVAEAFQFPAAIDAAPLKVCDYSDVAHSIFHQVCFLAGYTLGEIVAGAENHATVLHCAARAGEETYREFLDGLLSEHSLVLDDDGLGRLTTRRWTRADPGYDMILDGDDLSVVEPVVWARRYIPEDGVRLEWSEAKVIDDALLFRDSLPVSAQGEFTGQPIAPGDYYPADSDIEDMYQDYVERWLDRPYLERATRLKNKDLSLITTDQAQVVFQAEAGIVKELEAFEWGRAKVRFQNISASIKKMLSFEVRGRALIRSSIKSITAPENAKNPKTVTSRFLFNEASAIAYANAQALDIEYADFEYTFGLNRYLESGTVVRLINQKNNIDTRAIIQDCEFDIGRPVYRYKAIGLAEESSVASTSSVSSGTAAWPYLNSIDAKMASYAQNVPPTNNVTNLAFASEQNPSGMIDVTVSWDYTQGASPADGFLVFYKRDVTTPGAIEIFRDPSVFVPASSATEYQTILTLPARQAGAGTLPIHYRFGVVAFGTRRSGTVVHPAGVEEDPAWIDKSFAPIIMVKENIFWDQETGYFRSIGKFRIGDDEHYFGFVPDGETDPVMGEGPVARLHGTDLELSSSELITNKDGIELSHEGKSLVWRDKYTKDEILIISNETYMEHLRNAHGFIEYAGAINTSWICPFGVTEVVLNAVGKGGNGSAGVAGSRSGAGGGSAAWCRNLRITVTPGQSYNIVLSTSGNCTFFGVTLGKGGDATGLTPGVGGTGSGGASNGFSGGAGYSSSGSTGGGGGGGIGGAAQNASSATPAAPSAGAGSAGPGPYRGTNIAGGPAYGGILGGSGGHSGFNVTLPGGNGGPGAGGGGGLGNAGGHGGYGGGGGGGGSLAGAGYAGGNGGDPFLRIDW